MVIVTDAHTGSMCIKVDYYLVIYREGMLSKNLLTLILGDLQNGLGLESEI